MSADRLGMLGHELRSPVAALAALAEQAQLGDLPDEVLGRVVTLALAAGRDVERLLLDPDLLSIRLRELDLGELLDGLAGPLVVVTRREPAEQLVVSADPTRIRQAIGNLVANGLRHGAAVTIDARRDGGRALISVADDGPGVEPGIDPFARGVSGAGSSGYGLWLARAIADAHGGRLEQVTAPGQGAVFTLSLPLSSGASG